ncbi:hypothetical protein CAPTEDRAFT_218044 [Capitella teleta]|uniref:Uncharacterized protein n=1 Tax=Capitella teleta TaxID=283909 RepID=R7VI72_CAPTE|nr:hypothetical protein CAPTEDRAFT_218044 [Capitella teleta]|eukprot:ELU18232.1 hypothetical protein CAPTEDRAFT_218044 [Capitella teleta]
MVIRRHFLIDVYHSDNSVRCLALCFMDYQHKGQFYYLQRFSFTCDIRRISLANYSCSFVEIAAYNLRMHMNRRDFQQIASLKTRVGKTLQCKESTFEECHQGKNWQWQNCLQPPCNQGGRSLWGDDNQHGFLQFIILYREQKRTSVETSTDWDILENPAEDPLMGLHIAPTTTGSPIIRKMTTLFE